MKITYRHWIDLMAPDDDEPSPLIDWACDADRCKTNLAHATTRALITITKETHHEDHQ